MTKQKRAVLIYHGVDPARLISRSAGVPFARLRRVTVCAATMIFAVTADLAPLEAQEQTGPELDRSCTIYGDESASAGVQTIHAACWGTGIILGDAEQFQSFSNTALGATVVELEHSGRTRVLLLRPTADGQPIVENLGSALAVSAGRGPLGGIAGLTLDFGQFESDGVIGVQGGDHSLTRGSIQEQEGASEQTGLSEDDALAGDTAAVSPGAVDVEAIIETDPATAETQIAQ